MDLTYIDRLEPDEWAWSVTLPDERGGGHATFRDADAGGVLPALLEALTWRSEQTGAGRDWGWVEEGLERVDRGGTHGWWASVDLGTHLDADLFEDAEHGGPREALLAAIAWRRRVARSGGGGRRGAAAAGVVNNARGANGGRSRKGGRGAPRGKQDKRGAPAGDGGQPKRPGRKRPRRPGSRPSK